MQSIRTKKYLAAVLFLLIGVQSALISNGLLGVSMLTMSKLCTCDHTEISNKISQDDLEFSKVSLVILNQENHSQKNKSLKPTCHQSANSEDLSHTATPSEPHFCPHEKSQKNVENLASALNAIHCVQTEIIIEPIYLILSTLSSSFGHTLPEHNSLPFEPPRLS